MMAGQRHMMVSAPVRRGPHLGEILSNQPLFTLVDHQNADRVISHAVETAEKAILHAVEDEVDSIFHGAHGITSQSSIALTKSKALGARGGYALMLR